MNRFFKMINNHNRLYLLALCGVFALSGAIYAGNTTKTDISDKDRAIDLNDSNIGNQASNATSPNQSHLSGTQLPSLDNRILSDGPLDNQRPTDHNQQNTAGTDNKTGNDNTGSEFANNENNTVPGVADHSAVSSELTGSSAGNNDNNATEEVAASSSEVESKNESQTDASANSTDSGSDTNSDTSKQADSTSESSSKETSSRSIADLSFSADSALRWPLAGSVIKEFSADKLIYFDTLQQFRTNPAIFVSGTPGTPISAAADGIVTKISETDKNGLTVTIALGDDYLLTYGQMADLTVKEGDYVKAGAKLGSLAKVTKYFSTEGNHLYLQLTKDGTPIDPCTYLSSVSSN